MGEKIDRVPRGTVQQTRHRLRDSASSGTRHALGPVGASGTEPARRIALVPGSLVPGTCYRIDARIGEGGMGTVYAATHVAIERRVALKALHPQLCLTEPAVTTFRNEARASARIGAPNIVDILDLVELEDGRLIIVMEYLQGDSLHELIGAERPPIARVISIARQICKGLAAAHAAGIIHRDIKPENVMLVHRDGRADFVKLVDFGIAAFEAEGDAGWAGTPHYMAPESILRRPIDGRVDQYALGCVLYEWAVGHPPFEGDTREILRAQVEDPVAFPDDGAWGELPSPLRTIIGRCLAKDPKDRFADMNELEAALCELQVDLGVHTLYDDLALPEIDAARRSRLRSLMPRRRRRPRRPGRRLWLTAAAGLAGVLAGGADLGPGDAAEMGRATPTAPVAPAPRPSGPTAYVSPPDLAQSRPQVEARPSASRALSRDVEKPDATPTPVPSSDRARRADDETLARRYLDRAARARREGRAGVAETLYHRAIAADRGNLPALDGLASLHFASGEYGKSLRFAQMAARRGPNKPGRWLLLGDACFKTLRYEAAIRAYERAARLGEPSARPRIEKVRDKLRL
jgi:serine/threonine protein kinase